MTVSPSNSLSGGSPWQSPDLLFGAKVGVGLRHTHLYDFCEPGQPVDWLEIHSENFLAAGGPRMQALADIREHYPISCHGVGLSLGSATRPDPVHLQGLRALFARLQPALISEHLSWSTDRGVYLNDLLPMPLNDESLSVLSRNIDIAQTAFKRRLLIENPSTYLDLSDDTYDEPAFLVELVKRTGCGLLLDVNNIFVSGQNRNFDPEAYLAQIPADAVGEIHVAGHTAIQEPDLTVLIDDHGSRVCAGVWALLEAALKRVGPKPVLVEWDTNIPALPVLLGEAATARQILADATGAGGEGANRRVVQNAR